MAKRVFIAANPSADILLNLYSVQAKEQFMQFSKEPILRNFGDLPFGEIPEPLKFVRPFSKYSSIAAELPFRPWSAKSIFTYLL